MTTSERWYVPLFVVLLLPGARAGAQEKKSAAYPTMAPIEQYRIANREAEIALARSAAPPSVSAAAEVLVLGSSGYETAVKGRTATCASSSGPGPLVSTIRSSGIPYCARRTASIRPLCGACCRNT